MNLTQKQENFTQNLFKGMYQRDAYIDAYHPTYAMMTIDANASRLANNEKVKARLDELNLLTQDETVATVIERKQRLTEIIRDRSPSTIQAIAELNKMEKVYEAGILIDNRTQILITPGMRTLAAREMMEIKEEEAKLLEGDDAQGPGED